MEELKKAHVAVCIPSRGQCDFGFTMDLATMFGFTVGNDVATVSLLGQEATYIHCNRNDLARRALNIEQVTHLLWLDDDMRFPKDTLYRLLKHNEAFVGTNYSTRKTPSVPVTCEKIFPELGKPAKRLITPEGATGLADVEAVGFGCVLVRREVFEETPFPWFECRYDYDRKLHIGEDIWFSMLATNAGFRIKVDQGLSDDLVGHVGKWDYRMRHARTWASEVEDLTEIKVEA